MRKRFRKMTAVLLSVVIIALMISFELISVSAITQNEFDNKINSLRSTYYNGYQWLNSFDGASQCCGFAYLMGYEVFGSKPRYWNKTNNMDNLKIGDIIQYGDADSGYGHTVFVTNVSGNGINYVDCNGNGNITNGVWVKNKCIVKWDNYIKKGASYSSYRFSYVLSSPGIEANINPPSNVWLEKNKDWYETNDTITLTAHADNADTYWISIYKDGQHIFTQQFSETLSFPANQYGGGDYYAWITAHNAAGDTDSSPISFLVISKPTDVQLNCDKSVIAIGETITFTMSSNTATNYYIGIDKDGTRIIGEQINSGKTYTFDESGSYSAYVTAWNSLGEIDSNIVRFTVFDSDTEKPNYNYKWINYITNDSFRINIEPTDNVGIKKVIVATWTQSDKSDLVWHDAHFNGVAWYYLDIIRADYSAWQNSLYHNVFYIYDYADNCLTVQCDQDYKIISDTGKSIPEGEYRIVTALDERKALHIENDSTEDKADVQISSNLTNSKQTFYLKYKNNGFYTIENSYSGNVIDVWNDTYVVGTNVVSHQYLGGANQEWMFKPTDDGYYTIVSHSNGQALDVQDYKTDDGSTVFVYTLKEPYEINQKWKLRRVLKQDMVKVVSWKSVNGVMKPNVKVIVDGKFLVENTDYTVSSYIENNTLYAKITGIDNYCDSVSMEYQEPKFQIGDTNLDGNINVRDVTAIQRHLADLEEFNEEHLAVADTNGDCVVDIADATHLQMYLAEYGVVLGEK